MQSSHGAESQKDVSEAFLQSTFLAAAASSHCPCPTADLLDPLQHRWRELFRGLRADPGTANTNQSSSLLRLFQPRPLNPGVGRAECREPGACASDLPQEHLQRLLPLSPSGNRSQTLPRKLLLTNVLGHDWKWKNFLRWFLCHTIHALSKPQTRCPEQSAQTEH